MRNAITRERAQVPMHGTLPISPVRPRSCHRPGFTRPDGPTYDSQNGSDRDGQADRHLWRGAAGVRARRVQHDRPAPRKHDPDPRPDHLEGTRPDPAGGRWPVPAPRSAVAQRHVPARRARERSPPQRWRRVHDGLDAHRVRRQAQGRRRAPAGHDRARAHREPHPRPDPGEHRRLHARAPDRRRQDPAPRLRAPAHRPRARPCRRQRARSRQAAAEDPRQGVRARRRRPRRDLAARQGRRRWSRSTSRRARARAIRTSCCRRR